MEQQEAILEEILASSSNKGLMSSENVLPDGNRMMKLYLENIERVIDSGSRSIPLRSQYLYELIPIYFWGALESGISSEPVTISSYEYNQLCVETLQDYTESLAQAEQYLGTYTDQVEINMAAAYIDSYKAECDAIAKDFPVVEVAVPDEISNTTVIRWDRVYAIVGTTAAVISASVLYLVVRKRKGLPTNPFHKKAKG